MPDVNTAQLPAIMSALTSAVNNYHIGIITAGDFLTNDQTGAALPATPTPTWRPCWASHRVSGGTAGPSRSPPATSATRSCRATLPARSSRPTPTQGYTAYQGVAGVTADVLVNQNVSRRRHAARCRRNHDRRHQRAFRHRGSARRQQPVVERHPERRARHAAGRHAAHVP